MKALTNITGGSDCKQVSSIAVKTLSIAFVFALAFTTLAGCASNESQSQSNSSAQTAEQQAPAKIEVAVSVQGELDGQTVVVDGSVVVDKGATALDALESLDADVVVEDSAFGPYVTSINGLAAGGSSGWTYTVNGEMPSVSAGEYKLSDSDVVDWKYSTFE